MSQCTILTTIPTRPAVHSPYNRDFAAKARMVGGTWDRFDKVWRFPGFAIETVQALCEDYYPGSVVVADAIPVPEALPDYGHVGTVGAELTVVVTIDRVISNVGNYGANLHKMHDASGHVITWFASTVSLEVGKTYRVTGRVKKHDTYQGVSQTILTRCKAVAL